jgi:tetratricopeptide (TPR) repeat protein
MNDAGPPASVVPLSPPPDSPADPRLESPAQVPAPGSRTPSLSALFSAFSFLIRRPGRAAAIALLVLLIGFGAWMIGLQIWGYTQFHAAAVAVEHYHNREAREHLQAYMSVWPHDPAALLLAARTARRAGGFEEAQDFLDQYEKVRGKDDDALILERVLQQAQHGRVDRVHEFCEIRVRQNHPDSPLILEAVSAGLMRIYRLQEAEERIQTWLKLRPDDCQALLFEGIIYDLQSRIPEATANYLRVVNLDPDNEEARLRLTGLLVQNLKGAEALPHLEYLRKRTPDDPRVAVRIAQCRRLLAQPEEAKKILDDVLARYPHFPEALAVRGKLAMEDGNLAEAETLLREAAARDPSTAETHYHLSQCLTRQGKEAESKEVDAQLKRQEQDLKDIDELINGKMEQSRFDPALHYKAGMIAMRAGSEQEGVRWLESALELDPNYAPAHEALATYYQQIGDLGRAASHREKAVAAPNDAPQPKP